MRLIGWASFSPILLLIWLRNLYHVSIAWNALDEECITSALFWWNSKSEKPNCNLDEKGTSSM